MIKVGITGGIGAGKTIVCDVLNRLGVPVFNADLESKKIADNNLLVQSEIRNTFGDKVFTMNGTLNRKFLADIVFKDPELLSKLNYIIHPHVKDAFLNWAEKQNSLYVVEEAAILFESGSDKLMDKTIMVYSDVETRIKRIMKRNGISRDKVKSIIANQMNDEEKCKKADFVIYNNEKTLLLPQILKIHKILSA